MPFRCALALFLLLSLGRHAFDVRRYFFEKTDFIFWIYLASISISVWCAPDRKEAFNFFADFSFAAIGIYFFMKNEMDASLLKKTLSVLVISATAVSLFGFWEMLTRSNVIYAHYLQTYYYGRFIGGRMMSTLVHPNILGAYMLACIPAAYYLYRRAARGVFRVLYIICFLLIAAALFLAYSRGTLIAAFGMLTVWLFLKGKGRYALLMWGAFFLFSFAVRLSCPPHHALQRFWVGNAWEEISRGHRTKLYFVTFKMCKQHPFVGIGLHHYRKLFEKFSPDHFPYELRIPESIYLMHLGETGIIGFAGFAFLLWQIFKKSAVGYKWLAQDRKGLFFAVIMGLVGLLLNLASFDGFMWRTPLYLFWLFGGIIAGISRQEQ